MHLSKSFCILLLISSACTRKESSAPAPQQPIAGGKGGPFSISVFPQKGKAGVPGKCYIKYACNAIPSGATTYDDSSATMTEPGYGPHVHFTYLKAGFYLVRAKGTFNAVAVSGDTIIEIRDTSRYTSDHVLQVH